MISFLKQPAWVIFVLLMLPIPFGVASNRVGTIFWVLIFITWLLLMGQSIKKFNPPGIKFSSTFFIFRLVFSAAYLIAGALAFKGQPPNWLIPMHLLAFMFILSSLAANAKLIVNAETQKKNGFIDSLGTFLLLWFYPVGIWFVQPRLNAVYKANTGT